MQDPFQHYRHSGQVIPEVRDALGRTYSLLRGHFGYFETWWPGSPWRITLSAMLVQQCDWTVANQAVSRLEHAGLFELDDLSRASADEVRRLIHPVTFSPTKAGRLVNLARTLRQRGFHTIEEYLDSGSTEGLRVDLLTMKGIGEETADCILLYAGTRHPCFVVDASARRVFSRLQILPGMDENFRKLPYSQLRRFLHDHLLPVPAAVRDTPFASGLPIEVAWMRDYHAQIVELGRHHCLKQRPRCFTAGLPGWKDYDFCLGHCTANGCTTCPASVICGHANQSILS